MVDIILNTPLYYAGAFLLGLLIGSFLNVVIYRVPVMLEREWKSQCSELLQGEAVKQEEAPFNLAWPPSRCPSCNRNIKAAENIPILSYLILKGGCKGCGARISPRYPLIELLTGILFAYTVFHFGPTIQALTGLLLVSFLIALTFIDFDHKLLPDNLTIPLTWIGLLISIWGVYVSSAQSILGAIVGYLFLWSVFHLFRLITGKEGMGYGDFKLLAALGAWLGLSALPLIILIASLVGSVLGLLSMAFGKLNQGEPVPFGPFLATGGLIAFFWGEKIMSLYFHTMGIT